jgi:hypothetical protein
MSSQSKRVVRTPCLLTQQETVEQAMSFQVAIDASHTSQNTAMAILASRIKAKFLSEFF